MRVLMLMIVLICMPVWALAQTVPAQPATSCTDQLMVEKMHVYNLDQQRDQIEVEKAKVQYALYQEQQRRAAVEKELTDLKKSLEPKPESKGGPLP